MAVPAASVNTARPKPPARISERTGSRMRTSPSLVWLSICGLISRTCPVATAPDGRVTLATWPTRTRARSLSLRLAESSIWPSRASRNHGVALAAERSPGRTDFDSTSPETGAVTDSLPVRVRRSLRPAAWARA